MAYTSILKMEAVRSSETSIHSPPRLSSHTRATYVTSFPFSELHSYLVVIAVNVLEKNV
jgi:hypothetical protein